MMSTIRQDEIFHDRTQLKQDRLCFKWTISHFWEFYKFGTVSALSNYTKSYFNFQMNIAKDKLDFYLWNSFSKELNRNISYSVSLRNNKGEWINVLKPQNFTLGSGSHLLYALPISLLCDKDKMYLSDNEFTICFDIHIFLHMDGNRLSYSYETPALANTKIFVPNEKSDSFVSFIINNECLEAKKSSLCSKSKVFEAMFNSGLEESVNNEVVITDIRYDILKELLSFVQIGYLSKPLEKINVNEIGELFIAADKYDVQDLKSICEQNLIINTTKKNVVEHLKIAHLHNGEMLEKYTKDFIEFYSKDIADTPEFITLMQMYPELLTRTKNIEQIEQNVEITAKSV